MAEPKAQPEKMGCDSLAQGVDLLEITGPVATMGLGTQAEGNQVPGSKKEYSGWDVYNNEAKKVDTELVKDWRESLNSLLLFAAIFAAVLTAFIIESKKLLEVDPNKVMVDIMIFYLDNLANGTHRPYIPPEFEPNPSSISLNCLFFASLSTSLVAALASVVALQWVADYDAAITRGGSSPEDRAKRRQFRYAGVVQWKMNEIVAALPLLLYCSVILFFTGLILWMSIVHVIVGVVVAGGAAIALLFYGSSTLLAVAFVSAPFRTPLSRWLYTLAHHAFSSIYRLVRTLRVPSIPGWLESRHIMHVVSRKREDVEVEKSPELTLDALVWLASHLSVSQDSYQRLLLLASELPRLGSEHISSSTLGDAPWFLIFDLLGWTVLKTGREKTVTEREMHTVSVLAQCYRIPAIYDIIRPKSLTLYVDDAKEEEYWSQYCETPGSQWTPPSHSNHPNAMFLLLRDIPLPTMNTKNQLELTIFLSRWRNSLENSHSTRKPALGGPPSFSEGSEVSKFGIYQAQYAGIVSRMARSQVQHNERTPRAVLDLLRARFEALLIWENADMELSSCLSMPVVYSGALEGNPVEMRSLHHAFTLLLVRNLDTHSGGDRILRVKEVLTMIWIGIAASWHMDRDNMRTPEGMEAFFDANKAELMKWIKYADAIPRIHEILHHLAAALTYQPEIGSIWRVVHPQAEIDPQFVEALRTFDRLIERGVTPSQHRTLIDLVCQDIEMCSSDTFSGYFGLYDVPLVNQLVDPCLRFLAKYVGGLDDEYLYPPSHTTDRWISSWARIGTHLMKRYQDTDLPHILRLQASVWPTISDHTNDQWYKMLKEPTTLSHLRRMFAYPVPCPHHHDSEGHFLLHVFEAIPSCEISTDMTALTLISTQNRSINALLLMLVPFNGDGSQSKELRGYFDEKCLVQLIGIISNVKRSQFSLIAILSDIATRILEADMGYLIICAEDVAAFSICVNQALDLPREQRAAPLIVPLVNQVRQLKNIMLARKHRPKEENDIASEEAEAVIKRLVAHLASMTVSGRQNSRALSCVRPREICSPVIGWLRAHTD